MKHILRLAIVALSLSAEQAQAEISYADILADPDNPALNQQFARERLAGGDKPLWRRSACLVASH